MCWGKSDVRYGGETEPIADLIHADDAYTLNIDLTAVEGDDDAFADEEDPGAIENKWTQYAEKMGIDRRDAESHWLTVMKPRMKNELSVLRPATRKHFPEIRTALEDILPHIDAEMRALHQEGLALQRQHPSAYQDTESAPGRNLTILTENHNFFKSLKRRLENLHQLLRSVTRPANQMCFELRLCFKDQDPSFYLANDGFYDKTNIVQVVQDVLQEYEDVGPLIQRLNRALRARATGNTAT